MGSRSSPTPADNDRFTVFALLARYRAPVQITVDGLAWCLALSFATWARYEFSAARFTDTRIAAAIVVAVVIQVIAGLGTGLYLGRRRFGSFEEVAVLARAALVVTVLVYVLNLSAGDDYLIPRSAVIAGGVAALLLMGSVRYAWRLTLERRQRPRGDDMRRLLVFGAGDGAAQIVSALLADPASSYLPVALLDDDPRKRRLRIKGVPVVGDRDRLVDAAARYGADSLLIAIPSATSELIRELSDIATAAGLAVKVVPPVGELLEGQVAASDIRSVSPVDLLGRHEIDTDVEAIAGYLTGKRVLVTGAGGSVGGELCRQIYRLAPAELIMADRDESALHAVQLSMAGQASLDDTEVVLCDVRDRDRIDEVFATRRPQVVFHAAALKHVTALQRHPGEAVKTNVWGTLNLLAAAAAHGVERFVNISTDKAANPVSVLGYTKRVAERLTAHFASEGRGTFLSVRFGNVIGSRGSVLTVFQAQLAAGGPLTVTDPDVTRYFMTVAEAVQLVIQAGAIGQNGQALVLDMGAPVKIAEVAQQLAAQADRPIEVVYTGLRPGEKLHEELFGSGEVDHRPVHPLIAHVTVPTMSPAAATRLHPRSSLGELCDRLRELAVSGSPLEMAEEAWGG